MVFAFQGLILRHQFRVPRSKLLPLFLLGLAQTGLQYYFFYNGVARVSGIKGAILNAVGNFFVVIVAHFIYKDDRLNFGKLLGLVAGLAASFLSTGSLTPP